MKNKILTAVLVLTLILSLTSCGGSSGKNGASGDDEIVIAYIGALTGEGSAFALPEVNTLKMLVDKINDEGGVIGKKVVLKTYDNRNDNVETANAAKKAIQNDNANVIIGCCSSGPTLALAEVCEEFQVPGVTTTATNSKVTLKDDGTVRPYTFRVGLADPQIAEIMAHYAYEKMGIKTVGILQEISSDYSVGITDNFTDSFEKLGGKVVMKESYKTGDVDFRAQLANLKDADSDALFLPMQYKELGLAAKQARDLGLKQQFIGPDVWIAKDLFNVAGSAMKDSVFVAPIDGDDPALDQFKEWYREENDGSEPDETGSNAYFAYDAFELIISAIKEAESAEPTAIRDALEGIREIDGLTGPVSMDDIHNPIRSATIFRVDDGVFTAIDKYTVEK